MLNTKSIKSGPQATDGRRISIMSRHTMNDGIKPNPEILPEYYDEWWPELAPPPGLIGAYYKRGLSWLEFEEGYRRHITKLAVAIKVSELIDLAIGGTATVLCIEDRPHKCHRRLLAEECVLLQPELEVNIR